MSASRLLLTPPLPQLWRQLITGKCNPWTETEKQHAATISFVYGDSFFSFSLLSFPCCELTKPSSLGRFIKLWRESESHAQAGRLNKMLMGNAAHEARTPLNTIIK